jgi:thioredoxin 1
MKKVLKFSASWCGPCKMMSKILSTIETDVEIEEVDVDTNRELAIEYKVRGVPLMVMLEDGVEIRRLPGVPGTPGKDSKEIVEKFLNG